MYNTKCLPIPNYSCPVLICKSEKAPVRPYFNKNQTNSGYKFSKAKHFTLNTSYLLSKLIKYSKILLFYIQLWLGQKKKTTQESMAASRTHKAD